VTHDHDHGADRRRLSIALAIVVVFLAVEVVGAFLTGSLALLGDAGHMASDALGLIVAIVASVVAARPATDRQTFGFRRAEVFGALLNGVLLGVISIVIAIEAIVRLTGGQNDIASGPMLAVAIAGLAANVASALVLRAGAASSINMRAAYLDVVGDSIGSIAAIAAAIVILTTGFTGADAIASLIIAAIILPRAVLLLRDVVHVLSNATPRGTDIEQIRSHILGTEGVAAVHDVHVWQITSGASVFSAHVVVPPELFASGRTGELLDRLSGCLADHFDVAHSTFQLEPAEHADHEDHVHR
jgi:cobalt-zinc-cadmium efflux system protein